MKQMKLSIRLLSFVLALMLFATFFGPVTALAANTSWQINDDTRIFWAKTADSDCDNAALKQQIKLFDSELAEKVTTEALPISYGDASKAGASDIVLVLDSTLEIPAQGYQVATEANQVTISASDADGLFYGCRYLIQQLLENGSVSSISDSPDVLERALSLDCGRKYYTPEWIKKMIKELSWSNMNALVLHYSEEMGLGIESTTYPWLAGRDGTLCVSAEIETDNRYLTQDELREIAEVAALYHVELIPSFDSPGHMNYIVKKYNEHYGLTGEAGIGNYFHYNGQTAIVQGSRNKNYSRGIDISNETAVTFVHSLITEYANFFRELGCTKFDIGGDELLGWGTAIASGVSKWKQLDHWKQYAITRSGNSNAVAYDAFMYYMNDLYDLVSDLGYTSVRMWNDDALRSADTGWNKVVALNTNVEILYWTPTANSSKNNIWTYLNAGYKAYNYLNEYNYYVLGSGAYAKANQEDIYSGWNPYVFDPDSSEPGGKNVKIGNSNIKGSAFCIWCDNPAAETEESVMTNVLPMIRAHGAKAWDANANEALAYTTFSTNLTKIGAAPAGDVSKAGDISVITDVDTADLEAEIAEYGATDQLLYTEESFGAYTYAVKAAQELLDSGTYTQEDVDASLDNIRTAKEKLRKCETISDVECFISGSFKVSKVTVGKVATLNMSAYKGLDIVDFEIYSDLGTRMTITRSMQNTTKSDRDNYGLMFRPSAEERGERTYTVYAVLPDGTRSADCLILPLTVK